MKSLFIVANWKSNKTKKETLLYLDILSKNLKRIDGKEVIICPNRLYANNYQSIRRVAEDAFGKGILFYTFDKFIENMKLVF